MEGIVKKKSATLAAILLCLVPMLMTTSCTSAFPNDKLDFMWRLDRIVYLNGHDYFGNECREETKGTVWYAFARDLVEINGDKADNKIGITTDFGDSLRIDYSMYSSISDLISCGIWEKVTTFKVEQLTSASMILTDSNVSLFFTRW